jgi:aspartate/methionine/tyrosine aminotransferase
MKSLNHEILPAERLQSVSEYYFSKKLKEIAALNAQGKNIISLGVGSPDMPPSAATVEALYEEAKKPSAHGYQSYIGIPELRQAFAAWYKKWFDVDLNPAHEIQPLIGSKEGILYVSLAFLNPGDGVLVPDPGYPTYSAVSKLVQAKIIPYALNEENGWQPDLEALEKTDLSNVKLMWVNYPNMPTGTVANKALFERLVAFGRKHHIVICNDNPYSFILNDERLSLLSVSDAKEHCIELNSMSKSHNMAGWRMGMLASNAQFVKWILKVKSNVDSGMFRPMQMAAVAALKSALNASRPALLEPVMCLEISVPEQHLGAALNLLGTHGGKVSDILERGELKIIRALAPMRELFGFSTFLRSSTQGRAGLAMRFERFDAI